MATIKEIKHRFGEDADLTASIAELTEFISMLTTGTVLSGGTLTIPILLAKSGKAAAALLKLTKVLLPDEEDKENKLDPAKRVDEIFYVFAQRAYLKRLNDLKDNLKSPKQPFDKNKHKDIIKSIERTIVHPSMAEAHFEFGWHPDSGPLALFNSYTSWLMAFLDSCGVSEKNAAEWLKAVESSARKVLFQELVTTKKNNQWLVNYMLLNDNAKILDILQDFITPGAKPELAAWTTYLEDLKQKPMHAIWGEEESGVGIDKLFVEPDYKYIRHYESQTLQLKPEPFLKNFLAGLLTNRRPSTELIFLMGGPGSGKTSVMEIFCAELAATEELHIVLVPAKRLNPSRGILSEVQRYLTEIGYQAIADMIVSSPDCIIAIDGFDELAHATLSTMESFFRNAQDLVKERSGTRLRLILSGRPTLFSANDVAIPIGSHIVTIERFNKDRVIKWSENWRNVQSSTFDGTLYIDSKTKDLKELASQPMLLYLLAKMHDDNKPIPIDFNEVGGTKYLIYSKIIEWVCKRQNDKKISDVPATNMRRFLQIAGLATHQSGQRVLHWGTFADALKTVGLINDPQDSEYKAYSTILSFAFTNIRERSWEFTHKSFGEALAAEAMGRVLEDIAEKGKHGDPWRLTLLQATEQWIETFGPYFLTKDILDFCQGWLQTKDIDFMKALVCRLLEVYEQLMSPYISTSIAKISNKFDSALFIVLGNAVRSWFALSNLSIGLVVEKIGVDALNAWSDRIQMTHFRAGIYLSNVVSPVTAHESDLLFSLVQRLVKGRIKDGLSTEKVESTYEMQNILPFWNDLDRNQNYISPDYKFLDFERNYLSPDYKFEPIYINTIDSPLKSTAYKYLNYGYQSYNRPMHRFDALESLIAILERLIEHDYPIGKPPLSGKLPTKKK